MTDRELLEYAAKAAGMYILPIPWPNDPDGWFWCDYGSKGAGMYYTKNASDFWNPLKDDGYALRLAVMLKMDIYIDSNLTEVMGPSDLMVTESHLADSYAATRRSIVRAAAEIGKAMK